jgi:hypothetical protein
MTPNVTLHAAHHQIEKEIRITCQGQLESPCLDQLSQYLNNAVLPWLHQLVEGPESDTGLFLQKQTRMEFHMYEVRVQSTKLQL